MQPLPQGVDPARLAEIAEQIGEPCAVAGKTLALLLGWIDAEPPRQPHFVVPSTRHPRGDIPAIVRRIQRWDDLTLVRSAAGVPLLDTEDGVISLAEHCDDGQLHTVVQDLAFRGLIDVAALERRRRRGKPGSARLGRVCANYLKGLDSPQEVAVYAELCRCGVPPSHLNVCVRTASGLTAGPFDGYADVGAAYQVEGSVHFNGTRELADARRDLRTAAVGVEVVKFTAPDVARRTPMLDAWFATVHAARQRSAGKSLEVLHLPGRRCPCGYEPD